jgi:hypothetical protein
MRVGVGVGVGVKAWRESFQTAPHAVGRCLKPLVQDAYGHGLASTYLGHAALGLMPPFLSAAAAAAPPPPPPPTTTPTTATRRAVASTWATSLPFVGAARRTNARGRQRCRVTPRRSTLHLAVDVQCSDSIPHTVAQVGDVCARNVPALDAVSTTGIIHRPYCSS